MNKKSRVPTDGSLGNTVPVLLQESTKGVGHAAAKEVSLSFSHTVQHQESLL